VRSLLMRHAIHVSLLLWVYLLSFVVFLFVALFQMAKCFSKWFPRLWNYSSSMYVVCTTVLLQHACQCLWYLEQFGRYYIFECNSTYIPSEHTSFKKIYLSFYELLMVVYSNDKFRIIATILLVYAQCSCTIFNVIHSVQPCSNVKS